ncbi:MULTISPECIES: helix-turn-helix domain-containing protein [Pectobacterium]|uniref:XRE family transcriptional regulator n=2 Tax=Pectobacterium TaxID=122277 RepID=A0AA93AKH5_9GAMM|nr:MULTISPECIES: helix-turn-helix transcriptional regulator [Pectobacterium]MBA0172290.1 helix-turn-helix transcriptional regulator [Pectobacterium versatile]MBA0185340.1 helix-turn-helix transcriptional regulator [Pectobacterium versatile]MBN3239274.1 helix-turn-helix transcriptional regulator [Pectobacterium versatile]MCA6917816.1 helix-turn-helix domain-containing protein [Pectobacterium versatile]MCA6938137.1 helix-turn-helix domain-containing protein [Pectobacterium versatile]
MMTKKNYHDVFCQRLKQARLAKGLSQKKLGIAAGIDEFVASTRINRYEKGVHEASIETAQQLAKALDVPLAYFYTENDELAEMMLAFLALSPEKRAEVLALVENERNT